MLKNVSFNDEVVGVIGKMADETILLAGVLSDLQLELSSLIGCLDNFVNAFVNITTEGDNVSAILNVISESVSFTANAFTILATQADAIAVLGSVLKALHLNIIGLVTGVVAYLKVSSLSMIATDLLALSMSALKVAADLVGKAMNNWPIILIIAGLTAIIAIFVKHITKVSEEQKRLNSETEELKKKNDELTKSMKESEEAYKKNSDKMALQASTAEKLAEKVYALYEEEGKSAEQKHQLALMVDELNKAMPGLNLLYDEEADLLNKSSDAVKNLIAAKKEELMQEAMAERAVELLKEQLELEYQREEVLKKIDEWDKATDVKADAKKKAIAELTTEYDILGVKLEETEGAVNSVMDSIIESSEKQAEAVKGASEEMTEDWKAYQDAVENSAKAAEEAAKREADALKAREEKLKSYKEAATDMFNAIDRESKVSVDSMIDNLKNNQEAVKEWSEGLEELAKRGVDGGILEELRKSGPQAAGLVNELVHATDSQLEELCTVFANGGSVATQALLTEFGLPEVVNSASDLVDNMAESMANNSNLEKETVRLIRTTLNTATAEINDGGFVRAGTQIAKGLAQGVRNGTYILVQAVRDMARAALSSAQTSLDIHSPSRVFRDEVGLMVALGFSEGIEDGFDNVSTAALKMSNKAVDGLDLGFMKAMQKLSDKVGNIMPIYATGQLVPAHTPYSNIISNSDNHSTAFNQYNNFTGGDMSDAQKIRLLQIQSRRMLKLGV